MGIFRDPGRFLVTAALCILFSALHHTAWGPIVKPLPILWWLLILTRAPARRPGAAFMAAALTLSALGDVVLEVEQAWLIPGTLLFLGATSSAGLGLGRRIRAAAIQRRRIVEVAVAAATAAVMLAIYVAMAPHLGDRSFLGALLLLLSGFLLTRACTLAAVVHTESHLRRLAAVAGSLGIVANYVLYAVDLFVTPLPRDVVIQPYFWGQAFLTWSFLGPLRTLAGEANSAEG